ncbi:MAG: nitroreductase family protein [Pseudomonadota bacterium]
MDLWEALEKRRTYRKFSAPPTKEQLDRLLYAGALAPSAGNRQAWEVVVITDPETRAKIGQIKYDLNQGFMPATGKSGALLLLQKEAFENSTTLMVYSLAPERTDPHRYDNGSAWLFVENICLAAVSLGLQAMIFALWDKAEKKLDKLLGVPASRRQVVGINLGVPDSSYKPLKKVLKPKTKWIHREVYKVKK